MEPEKMLESESKGSRSVNNLTPVQHNQDMKPLEQSVLDGDRTSAGGTFEGVVDATNGGGKPDGGGVYDETTPPLPKDVVATTVATATNADHIVSMDLTVIDETKGHQVNGGVVSDETPPPLATTTVAITAAIATGADADQIVSMDLTVIDETKGHQQVNVGVVSDETPLPLTKTEVAIAVVADVDGDQTLPMDLIVTDETKGHQQTNEGNDNLALVAIEEDVVDDGKRPDKKTKYNTDGDPKPPMQPNFTLRLFGVDISCYREEDSGSKDCAEGSSCTASDRGVVNRAAHGGGGCNNNGGPGVVDASSVGKPPVQEP